MHERDVLVERLDFAVDDLLDQVGRLAAGLDLLLEDPALALDAVSGDAVLVDADRIRRGDVLGDLLGEIRELGVARDEVRLAVELHDHAEFAVVVDVAADEALAGDLAGPLLGLDRTTRPQEL